MDAMDHHHHHHQNSTSLANPSAAAAAAAPSAQSIFSRRPSFFGGRHRSPKTPTHPPRSSSTVPPTIHLPPASPDAAHPPQQDSPYDFHFPSKVLTTPPRHKHVSRHSISSTIGDIGSQLHRSRSASLRTNDSSGNTSNTSSSHRRTPSSTLAVSLSPEKNGPQTNAPPAPVRPALSISTFSRNGKQKSADNVRTADSGAKPGYEKTPLSAVENQKTPFAMAVPLRYGPTQKDMQQARRQDSSMSHNGTLGPPAPIAMPNGANPHVIFQHIQELASKRISTLDYLRKAHEGRIYWFNTLLFSKNDLTRLPSFTPRNLARRATQYLLLGFSLPTILDLNSNSPTDYLKALNALLLEFEQYTSMHPADGSAPSSLGRGRIPGMQMFNRVKTGKGRRSSSAADGLMMGIGQSGLGLGDPTSIMDVPGSDDLLLPNESYSYLQTPSLPFDPDFFSTFATLCDVLIDCYTKILSLLATPESIMAAGNGVPSTVGDLFNKADARVRKIILANVVREFEESCRQGVKAEVGGVGKVVLGGLM